MEIFGFHQMQKIKKELQESCDAKRESNCSIMEQNELLWMIGEIAEVTEIVRKNGDVRIMQDMEVRKQFVEELYEVVMYVNDMMQYYDITPQDLQEVHAEKQTKMSNIVKI